MAEPRETWAIGRLLAATAAFLADKGSASPRLDAELMLSKVLALPKVQLYVNFERELSAQELDDYRELVRRRSKHEPVAYILGHKEFHGLKFKTSPAALIPRPETEHLVDEALRLARDLWPGEEIRIADIGCGSGAIALSLAANLKEAHLSAVDISPRALNLARENAEALGLAERVEFFEGDLLSPLGQRDYHLICANLPYIPSPEMKTLMPDVGLHEPHLALDGGPEGLAPILRLLESSPAHLRADGRILLEIWPPSCPALKKAAAALGFDAAEPLRDLAGLARVAVLKRSAAR
ncbi:MAG: peptide chain release factor N(5)-glutamine methyltransferase [Candidatus Adiutrix sp.]|jgi:release factor glutamine methyltransferase|nr:peptide chain release factor N(5)-glutamine methyltransferase [Candidatus Adiutrix sp.]